MKRLRPRSGTAASASFAAITAIAVLAMAAACGKGNSSSGTTSPSVTIKTETFTGTVPVRGSDFHTFSVAQAGEVDATLTAASPPSTITMGLAFGTVNGSACALIPGASTNTQAGTGVQLAGTVSPGSLCVQVSDVGNQTAPVTYTVTVAHP